MKNIEQLARILSEIHDNSFAPFYEEVESTFWLELPEKTENVDTEVDRKLFRQIAEEISKELKGRESKVELLARTLYGVHSKSLTPFYISKEDYERYVADPEDYWSSHTWELLEEKSNSEEMIDKTFFRNMADYIILNFGS